MPVFEPRDFKVNPLTRTDFPYGAITLDRICRMCDSDESRMWDVYFQGGMDRDVRSMFESALDPQARTVAVMLRAFLRALKVEPARASV